MVINHQKMELFFAFFFVDSGEEHTARVNTHHSTRRKICIIYILLIQDIACPILEDKSCIAKNAKGLPIYFRQPQSLLF